VSRYLIRYTIQIKYHSSRGGFFDSIPYQVFNRARSGRSSVSSRLLKKGARRELLTVIH
jgi:hypothetical protein